MRILLGIFSAVSNPASLSLIRDMFPESRQSTANAIFSTSLYFGTSAGSLSVLLIKANGWRFDYTVAGSLGIAIGLVGYFGIQRPNRGIFDKSECTISEDDSLKGLTVQQELTEIKSQFVDAFEELKENKAIQLILAGSSLRFIADYSALFLPSYFG